MNISFKEVKRIFGFEPTLPASHQEDIISIWRERIFSIIFISASVIGLFNYIITVADTIQKGWWIHLAVYTLGYLTILCAIMFRRIPFKIRAWAGSLVFFLFGVFSLMSFGMIGSGRVYLFAFSIVACLLLKVRGGLIALILNIIAIIAVGLLLDAGFLGMVAKIPHTTELWFNFAATFLWLNAIVTVALAIMVQALEESLIKEQKFAGELDAINIELKKDIDERKKIEEELQKEKNFSTTIIQASPVFFVAIDAAGKIIMMNDSMLNVLGYTIDEVIGKDYLSNFIPEEDHAMLSPVFNGLIKNHKEQINENGILTKGGTRLLVEWHRIPILDEKGNFEYFFGAGIDITERKRADEKLKQTLTDLKRSNTDLEQFAYVASHDLQEPIRMVSSYVQLLSRRYKDKLDSDADEFIGFAVDGATRMQTLINDLLAFSRVGTRGKPFEPTDCETLLPQTLANLKVSIDDSGAVITHDALPTVMADGSQLAQVFQNLISNAIKFKGKEPPRVHISAERRGDKWLFSVTDNGIGISLEFFDRIFVVFQRLHGRDEYEGTGIGLAVCKKIVERHGGRMWVESEPESGSTFYFTIPTKASGERS